MPLTCTKIFQLQGLFFELGYAQDHVAPIYINKTNAIQILTVFHKLTKHIDVDYHFNQEAFDDNIITLPHVSSDLPIADAFTKGLEHAQHQLLN